MSFPDLSHSVSCFFTIIWDSCVPAFVTLIGRAQLYYSKNFWIIVKECG